MVIRNHLASFSTDRISDTVFTVTEDDSYGEHSITYAKIYKDAKIILLSDTGCDSPSKRSKDAKFIKLREYLEECPIAANGGHPLNPDGLFQYIVIITHCHYDHIGSISQFYDGGNSPSPPQIVASKLGKAFIEDDIWSHSLYKYLGLPKPDYRPTCYAADSVLLRYPLHHSSLVDMAAATAEFRRQCPALIDPRFQIMSYNLNIVVFNTPGHTPDELAWYDYTERHLYVGDSFYYTGDASGFPPTYAGPIIFPKEGSWIDYMKSMHRLLKFTKSMNKLGRNVGSPRVRVGCAHVTTAADAETMLGEVIDFFQRIIAGKIEVGMVNKSRGELEGTWRDDKQTKLAVKAPLRLVEAYRERQREKSSSP